MISITCSEFSVSLTDLLKVLCSEPKPIAPAASLNSFRQVADSLSLQPFVLDWPGSFLKFLQYYWPKSYSICSIAIETTEFEPNCCLMSNWADFANCSCRNYHILDCPYVHCSQS